MLPYETGDTLEQAFHTLLLPAMPGLSREPDSQECGPADSGRDQCVDQGLVEAAGLGAAEHGKEGAEQAEDRP